MDNAKQTQTIMKTKAPSCADADVHGRVFANQNLG